MTKCNVTIGEFYWFNNNNRYSDIINVALCLYHIRYIFYCTINLKKSISGVWLMNKNSLKLRTIHVTAN